MKDGFRGRGLSSISDKHSTYPRLLLDVCKALGKIIKQLRQKEEGRSKGERTCGRIPRMIQWFVRLLETQRNKGIKLPL